jgi:hypothetical protein
MPQAGWRKVGRPTATEARKSVEDISGSHQLLGGGVIASRRAGGQGFLLL